MGLLRLCSRKGSWGTVSRPGMEGGEEEAERLCSPSHPASGYSGGTGPGDRPQAPRKGNATLHLAGSEPSPPGMVGPASPGPTSPTASRNSQSHPSVGQLVRWLGEPGLPNPPAPALPTPLALVLLLIHFHVGHQDVLLGGLAGAGAAGAAVAGALESPSLGVLSPPVEDEGRGQQG